MNSVMRLDVSSGEIIQNDPVALEVGGLFRHAHNSHVDSVRYLVAAGEKLKAKRDELSHGEWLPWLAVNRGCLGFAERTARLLISGAEKYRQLTADLEPKEALAFNRKIWGNHNHRAEGTGENEWYTPEKYIELARTVMGGIDLDPASSELAQETVGATQYFDERQNGLLQEWHGRVWLNPPYAQPAIQHFVEKTVVEYEEGRLKQAILLTHNYTDTEWFHIAAKAAVATCFTRGRIGFLDPQGKKASPTQGQAFFYFGDRSPDFIDAFQEIGVVMVRA